MAEVREALQGAVLYVVHEEHTVAKARHLPAGGWLLKIENACWLRPEARTGGLLPGKYPGLMVLKTKQEARRELLLLARQISS
jgi:hypothetical protein